MLTFFLGVALYFSTSLIFNFGIYFGNLSPLIELLVPLPEFEPKSDTLLDSWPLKTEFLVDL